MLPIIIGGVATAVIGVAGAVGTYFYTRPNSLGDFVVWGRPDTGKTTFISRLRGLSTSSDQKEATTSKKIYKNIKIEGADGEAFEIEKIIDMPGSVDRRDDWLKQIVEKNHIFYLLDLSRLHDRYYIAAVKSDLKSTVETLNDSEKENKKINIIGTHLDLSDWRGEDAARVNNLIQGDDIIRQIYESINGVSGYVYSANLMESTSFNELLQSVINDCKV